MAKIVKRKDKPVYLMPDLAWTKDTKKAKQFDTLADALLFVRKYNLMDAEIITISKNLTS